MAVNPGDSITAAQYNGLQSRIEQVLGNGSGNFGYGQTVTSSQINAPSSAGAGDGDSVTAAQMDNIRTDMNKVWNHQNGVNIPIKNIDVGDVIGADQTGDTITYDTLGNYTITEAGGSADTTGGFNDYISKMDEIETNRFEIDPGEDTIADIATDTRTSTWNGIINCVFTCTFSSEDHRRHFFNSGGQIRLISSGANGSGAKSSDWLSIITNPGQIQFGYNYTVITGSTAGVTVSNIGNYGLTSVYQTIFEKQGNAAVYAENRYKIEARTTTTNVIEFRVSFEDNDAGDQQSIPPAPYGPAVDEDVNLDITVTLATRRASGSNVSVNNPSVSVTNTLE